MSARGTLRRDMSGMGRGGVVHLLDSGGYESATGIGGDSDTRGSIAGGIAAQHCGGAPDEIAVGTRRRLPDESLTVSDRSDERYPSAERPPAP